MRPEKMMQRNKVSLDSRNERYGREGAGVTTALMLAVRITLAHFSVSSAMSLPKAAGVIDISTVYETEHPVVQVHPLTGERAIILGYFVRKLVGVSSADSGHLFAMLQDHVTRLENMVRWRWSAGDVVIWDNRATQHKAIDDYGDRPRIVRRVTVDGPVSVGIDGRHGKRLLSESQMREIRLSDSISRVASAAPRKQTGPSQNQIDPCHRSGAP
jgi:hypothetical protein